VYRRALQRLGAEGNCREDSLMGAKLSKIKKMDTVKRKSRSNESNKIFGIISDI
jgi:hypothetical protein